MNPFFTNADIAHIILIVVPEFSALMIFSGVSKLWLPVTCKILLVCIIFAPNALQAARVDSVSRESRALEIVDCPSASEAIAIAL